MSRRHAALHDDSPADSSPLAGPAPGKTSLTQRMARPAGPPAIPPPPPSSIDRELAAIQRRQLEHDLAGAVGFFGGPAETVDASIGRIQRKADTHTGLADDTIAAHASRGVSGPGGVLPHLETIQRAFGPHDVSGVRAHVGGAASEAATAIGAHAYATGNDVAFAREPDLFLAAHEAAHVVQQRHGVHLASAVGQDGDPYERHADEVAAAVVRGESAAGLLASGPGGDGGGAAVQRKLYNLHQATGYIADLDLARGIITIDGTRVDGSTRRNWRRTNELGANDTGGGIEVPNDMEPSLLQLDLFGTYDYNNTWTGDTKGALEVNQVFRVSAKDGVPTVLKVPSRKTQMPSPLVLEVSAEVVADLAVVTLTFYDTNKSPTWKAKVDGSGEIPKSPLPIPSGKAGAGVEYNGGGNSADDKLTIPYTIQLVPPRGESRPQKTEPPPGGDGKGGGGGNNYTINIGGVHVDNSSKSTSIDNSTQNIDQSKKETNIDQSKKETNIDQSKKETTVDQSKKGGSIDIKQDSHDDNRKAVRMGPPATPAVTPTPVIQLPRQDSVHFNPGDPKLTEGGKQKLNDWIAAVRANEALLEALAEHRFVIAVWGYASHSGTNGTNDKVSAQRAANVAKYLRGKFGAGIDVSTDEDHFGEDTAAGPDTNQHDAQEQRVDFAIVRK